MLSLVLWIYFWFLSPASWGFTLETLRTQLPFLPIRFLNPSYPTGTVLILKSYSHFVFIFQRRHIILFTFFKPVFHFPYQPMQMLTRKLSINTSYLLVSLWLFYRSRLMESVRGQTTVHVAGFHYICLWGPRAKFVSLWPGLSHRATWLVFLSHSLEIVNDFGEEPLHFCLSWPRGSCWQLSLHSTDITNSLNCVSLTALHVCLWRLCSPFYFNTSPKLSRNFVLILPWNIGSSCRYFSSFELYNL